MIRLSPPERRRWLVFGDFQLDRVEKRLLRKGEPIPLAPKTIELLVLLAQSRGALLSKETLIDALWPSTFVDENNLTQHVVRIRKALGDERNEGTYVETLPRRGYRFKPHVTETDEPLPVEPQRNAPTTAGRPRQWWKLAVAAAVVAAAAVAAVQFRPQPPGSRSVTVLPFRMSPSGSGHRDIANGVSDAVANRLGIKRGVKVHPAAAGLSDPRSAAKSIGVDAVVSGAVHVSGDTIRVTAQLFDVRRGENVWSRRFDTSASGLLEIQDAIADEIGSLLQPGLTAEQQARLTPPRSRDAVANAEYFRGRDLLDRRVRIPESIVHFERAVARDPDFGLGWAGLAEALAYPRHFSAAEPRRASAAARRALRLDPNLAEAHATLGFIHLFHDWNPPAAVRELRLALQLKPSSARVHDWYAIALLLNGRTADAVAAIDRARALDPAWADIAADAALVRLLARDFGGAERAARAALLLDPGSGNARGYLVSSLSGQRRFREAVTEVASASNSVSLDRAVLEFKAGDETRRDWIRSHLATRRELAPEKIASVHAILGDEAAALEWLERAMEQRSWGLMFALFDPAFDPIRGNARFQRVVREVGVTLPSSHPHA